MRFYRVYLVVIICALCTIDIFAAFDPHRLTCEYKAEPLGIEVVKPRFGWWINADRQGAKQSAYQIQVADSRDGLVKGDATLWESTKVASNHNSSVYYAGKPLLSARKYYWRVRVWDERGEVSKWSKVAMFQIGMLSQNDWNTANWIGYETMPKSSRLVPGMHGGGDQLDKIWEKRAVNPFLRKSFSVKKKVAEATVFVSGMGQYELYLNGRKVSDDFLTPGWTNYEKRCLYNTYDVSTQLRNGENVLGSIVGSGFFYVNRERYRKYTGGYGFPMLRAILKISYTDGSTEQIVTDKTWKTVASPLNYSSIYGGENYDARLDQPGWNNVGFNDATWKEVVLAEGPGGKMAAQLEYPLRVMDTIRVKNITVPSSGRFIYDFGQNASGIVSLKVQGKAGDTIRITPSEMLDEKGIVSQISSGGPYYLEYVLKGDGIETWKPRFTYYGFRYAMVEGAVPADKAEKHETKMIALDFLHTRNSAATVGSFESSSPLLNNINGLINWALKSNIASVSTDCPHREKMGWLEQAHLMGESLKYNFDSFHLYNKIVDDMIEAQLPNGMIPSIAPEFVHFQGPFRDDPGYGSAAVVLPWFLYKWYGDKEVLNRSYDMMKRYVAYLGTRSSDHILSHGLGDWLDLGPKAPGEAQLTPVALTATAFYYQAIQLMGKMASVLEIEKDAKQYELLSEEIKNAFNKKFFNPKTKVYGTGSQTSYSMPLHFGLIANKKDEEGIFRNLVDSIIVHEKSVTAGDIGHRFFVQTLQRAAPELLFEIYNRTDRPGYGYQLKHGSTALAEHWSGAKAEWLSQNHMIFGHLMEWFYAGLGGIKQQDNDSGFQRLRIEPQFVGDVSWVKTHYEAVNGNVKVNWKKSAKEYSITVVIPVNTEAEVVLPVKIARQVRVNGKGLQNAVGVAGQKTENGSLLVSISSGTYNFVCTI